MKILDKILEPLKDCDELIIKEAQCFIPYICETISCGAWHVEFKDNYFYVPFSTAFMDTEQKHRFKILGKWLDIKFIKMDDGITYVTIPNELYKTYKKDNMLEAIKEDFV
jgi:hypothetical protein